eukprot:m.111846 g.111846  ORF g.111846 m.111846 type:complete len:317 (-) comp17016_c0_seq4:456-1406(-)
MQAHIPAFRTVVVGESMSVAHQPIALRVAVQDVEEPKKSEGRNTRLQHKLPVANVMTSTEKYDELRTENAILKAKNNQLYTALKECQAQRDLSALASVGAAGEGVNQVHHRQTAEIRALVAEKLLKNSKDIDDLFKENERLSEENKELKKEIEALKKEIGFEATILQHKETLAKHEETLTKHGIALNRLMERENLITAREAAQSLEWFVCVEAQQGNWKKTFKDTRYLAQVEDAGLPLPLWMDEPTVKCLRQLKGDGDDYIHQRKFTEAEVEDAFRASDQSTLTAKMKLLAQLKNYYASYKIPFGMPIDRQQQPKL